MVKVTRHRGGSISPTGANTHHPSRRHYLVISVTAISIVVGALRYGPFLQQYFRDFAVATENSTQLRTASTTTPVSDPPKCLDIQVDRVNSQRITPNFESEPEKCLLYEKPSPYIDLVMKAVAGFPNHGACNLADGCKTRLPYIAEAREYGNDWPPFAYTMVGFKRLENFRAAILDVNRNNIPGSIMELGVWRGGAMLMAAALCNDVGVSRDLWLLDAFELLPKATYGQSADYLFTSEQGVRDNFEHFNLNSDKVHFLKGMFEDTTPVLKQTDLGQIAVLRVDGNFYHSYQAVMYNLYENVPVGGIVIFDDVFSHPSVYKFWLHFREDQGLTEELNRIDTHSGWFRKQKVVTLDMSKMRPPGVET